MFYASYNVDFLAGYYFEYFSLANLDKLRSSVDRGRPNTIARPPKIFISTCFIKY